MDIGRRIRQLRVRNGLTQQEIASRCELTKGFVSQLENNLTTPSLPALMDLGLKGMIGKGARSQAVIDAITRNHGVYFAAIGGAAALIAKSIKKEELLCYEDLGTEAVRRYTVEDFPCIVAIDCEGNNVYETEPLKYRKKA